jgi:hypothetical protein
MDEKTKQKKPIVGRGRIILKMPTASQQLLKNRLKKSQGEGVEK